MLTLIRRGGWLATAVIILMPILFTFYLGLQMGYRQVADRFATDQQIPEITRLADLTALPAGEIVMLRGQIADSASPADPEAPDLIIYQERPSDGREVRFQEEFPLIFTGFRLALTDGSVPVVPSLSREHVIRDEPHQLATGDRLYTGFRSGDMVTVQGEWQPGPQPTLVDVTGVSGADRATLLAEWEAALRQTRLMRDALGLLSMLSLVLFIVQVRRAKKSMLIEESNGEAACPTQTTETIATTSAG